MRITVALPFVLLPVLVAVSGAQQLTVRTATGELSVRSISRGSLSWIDMRELGQLVGADARWEALPQRQVFRTGQGTVVVLVGVRQARLGERFTLLPAPPILERDRLLAPERWVREQLLPYWGLSAVETAAPGQATPTPRPLAAIPDTLEDALSGGSEETTRLTPRHVILDPGHGGQDSGSPTLLGGSEAEITLRFCRRVADELESSALPVKAELTRLQGDTVSPMQRISRVNTSGADLLVSIHAGARRGRGVRGIWIYYPSSLLDAVDSTKVNSTSGWEELDDAYRRNEVRSRALARHLERELRFVGHPAPVAVPANLAILRRVVVPAVLIELADVSDEAESAWLSRRQSEIAEKLAQALRNFPLEASPR